jgi:hypothetical protein
LPQTSRAQRDLPGREIGEQRNYSEEIAEK